MKKLIFVVALVVLASKNTYAQNKPASEQKPRRQFVTFSVDRMNTFPFNFKSSPLEQLAKTKLYYDYFKGEYHSKDGEITVNKIKLTEPTKGFGLTVYPFGAKNNGASLAIKGSYETLPIIGFTINSPSGKEVYLFENGRAYDLGVGVVENDRPKGWGLGARSFVFAGKGMVKDSRGNGERYFIEGGGGVSSGPIGVEVFFKSAQNRLSFPRPHYFYSMPVGLRATFSF